MSEEGKALMLVPEDTNSHQLVVVVVIVIVIVEPRAKLEDVATADRLQLRVLQDPLRGRDSALTSQQKVKGVVLYHLVRLGSKIMQDETLLFNQVLFLSPTFSGLLPVNAEHKGVSHSICGMNMKLRINLVISRFWL